MSLSGGGGSSQSTFDAAYNAGLLELSEEQQGWAREMFNMYKFGVPYDPNEQVTGRMVDGEFVPSDTAAGGRVKNPDWRSEHSIWQQQDQWYREQGDGSDPGPAPSRYLDTPSAPQEGLVTMTRGELEGYDASGQTSEMQYLQNLVNANQSLLGLQTDTDRDALTLEREQMGSATRLLPHQEGLALETLTDARTGIAQRAPVREAFYREALTGVDPNRRADQAQAGVQHGFKKAGEAARMDISQYGLDPGSGRYGALNRGTAMAEASGIAGARTAATERAENEKFERLKTGLSMTG